MRARILGVEIDRLGFEEAVSRLREFHGGGRPRLVVTPNPEIIQLSRRDPELREILNRADLSVPDGTGVVLAGRLLGTPFPGRVPGIDLAWSFLATVGEARVFLLGGREGVAEAAGRRLAEAFPQLRIVGSASGYFTAEEEPRLAARIRELGPTVLLAGMGSPRQERWLHLRYREVGADVNLGVGGSFDVWAGRLRRAPAIFRRLGLEWLYRLLQEPWRYRRMLVLPMFLGAVLWRRGEP